jgi:hypothetical protein
MRKKLREKFKRETGLDVKETMRVDVENRHYIDVTRFNARYINWLESEFEKEVSETTSEHSISHGVSRCLLVSFSDTNGVGSIWFQSKRFPSYLEIKKVITDKYPEIKNPAITNIVELSEEDFTSFNSD